MLMSFLYLESIAWVDSPAALEATVERVAAVKALGMDVGIDFHGKLSNCFNIINF